MPSDYDLSGVISYHLTLDRGAVEPKRIRILLEFGGKPVGYSGS